MHFSQGQENLEILYQIWENEEEFLESVKKNK